MIVSGTVDHATMDCKIEIDDYIPLLFRSYSGTLGVKYIRYGDGDETLLELLLDPITTAIRGFTLVSVGPKHHPELFAELPFAEGLPVMALLPGENFQGSIDESYIEIHKIFSLGAGPNFIEIDMGGITAADRYIKCKQVEFYICVNNIVGIRIVDLSQDQVLNIFGTEGIDPLDQ